MTSERKALLAILAAATAIRLAALGGFGPVHQDDSMDLYYLVTILLKDADWLSFADISQLQGYYVTLRVLGYPLLMAAMQLAFGSWAEHVIVLLQSACSVIATGLVFRTGRAIGLGVAASCFAALAHTSSIALLFDFNILVDSIYANGILISTCLLTLGIYSGRAPAAWRILAIGLLLVTAFLVRETTMFFMPVLAVGVVIWAHRGHLSWAHSGMYVVIFILPVLCANTAYREWNRHRTGVSFLTTGAQMSMWFAPVEVARARGTALFSDEPRIAEAIGLALQADPEIPMTGAVAINRYFFAQGLKATDISGLAFKAYGLALKGAPVTLMKDRLSRYRARAVLLLVNASFPLESLNDFTRKRNNTGFFSRGRAAIAAGGIEGAGILAWMAIEVVQLAASAILLLAFVVGIPILLLRSLLRRCQPDTQLIVLGWFWCIYWVVNGAYIMVSFEGRYALPTLPLACLAGLWICLRGLQAFRAARNASYSRM